MRFLVTAGYVTVETAVPGGRAHVDVTRDSILPADVPAEQVQLLLAAGDIAPVVEPQPDPELAVQAVEPEVERASELVAEAGTSGSASATVPDGTVAEVLAWVGGAAGRAAEAIAAERAAVKPRTTLIRQLAELAEHSEEE